MSQIAFFHIPEHTNWATSPSTHEDMGPRLTYLSQLPNVCIDHTPSFIRNHLKIAHSLSLILCILYDTWVLFTSFEQINAQQRDVGANTILPFCNPVFRNIRRTHTQLALQEDNIISILSQIHSRCSVVLPLNERYSRNTYSGHITLQNGQIVKHYSQLSEVCGNDW